MNILTKRTHDLTLSFLAGCTVTAMVFGIYLAIAGDGFYLMVRDHQDASVYQLSIGYRPALEESGHLAEYYSVGKSRQTWTFPTKEEAEEVAKRVRQTRRVGVND